MAPEMDRRDFLKASALAAAGVLSVACAKTAEPTAAPEKEPAKAEAKATATPEPETEAVGKESPQMAELVKAGTLPAVEERLPLNPHVVRPGSLITQEYLDLQIGKYGGTMQLAQENPGGDPHIYIGTDEYLIQSPNCFDYDKGIEGNVLDSWQANDDNTVFTFKLRKGMKWSDGEPVTMDDVKFAWEDVLNNQEITPVFPAYLKTLNSGNGSPAKLDYLDDMTFSLTFDEPYGCFLVQIGVASWRAYMDLIKPRHYLEQFHIEYTPLEELKPLMEKESIPENEWFNLFNAKQMAGNTWKVTNESGIGHPNLTCWAVTKVDGDVFTYERNPYYFKVDTAGNQLPYIDGIRSQVVADKETLTARALMGEFDYLGERASLKKLPLMKEQEQAGKIKVYIPRMHRTPIGFHLNLSYDDPVWREVTGDVRFRQALSYAINRPEILKTFYLNQFAHLPEDANPSEYNVEKANQLLDEMGMDQKDGEGYRLGPDGERFDILFEVADLSEDHVPMSELIAEYWKEVGVYTDVKKIDGALRGQREQANELQADAVWPVVDMWVSASWYDYLPNHFAPLWNRWYNTQGKGGEEPPAEIKELFEAHEAFMVARPGTQQFRDARDEVLRLHKENLWYYIPVERSYYATFFTNRMQNVPVGQHDLMGIVTMHAMEIWYIEE
jgi:peptide/nickel transport system substrate-binding protein